MHRVEDGPGREVVPSPPQWSVDWRSVGVLSWFAVTVLLLSTQPFFDMIPSRHWRIILGTMWGSVFLAGLGLAWRVAGLKWLLWSLQRVPLLWFLLLSAVASSLWSLDPAWTLYSVSWPLGLTLIGITLGYLIRPDALMGILASALAAFLLASLAVELLSLAAIGDWRGMAPHYQYGNYRWTGTTPNPNFLGEIAATAGVFFLVALVYGRLAPAFALAMLLIAVLATFMSRSATSIVMLVTGSAVVAGFYGSKRLRIGGDLASVLLALGLLISAALALSHWEQATLLLGKDVTATNRLDVWADALAIIEYRPLYGFGFGVVFGLFDLSFFPEFETTTQTINAHNGYLELAAEVGLPALAVALLLLLHALLRAIRAFSRWSSAFALFAASYVIMFMIENLTETRLLVPGLFTWFLFVVIATALTRADDAAPRPRRPVTGRETRA